MVNAYAHAPLRPRLSWIGFLLAAFWGCARATPAPELQEQKAAAPVEIHVSTEPTTARGNTPVWVRLHNASGRELAFTMAMTYRVTEDPSVLYSYAAPERDPQCGDDVSPTYRLKSDGAFEVRLDVPTPSPLAERVLVSAEIELCGDLRGTYRVYAEAPLATGALARRFRGS